MSEIKKLKAYIKELAEEVHSEGPCYLEAELSKGDCLGCEILRLINEEGEKDNE